MNQLIIFTDLDGTLLDHDNYSWAAAREAVSELRARQIPLILNSSKTAAEIEQLRDELGNTHPFVVENGGAVYIPRGYFPEMPQNHQPNNMQLLGSDRKEILATLQTIKLEKGYQFTSFAELSAQELATLTGLSLDAAKRASMRVSSEPLTWQDSDENLINFRQTLHSAGLKLLKGGRFYHVMGQTDKATGVSLLIERYRAFYQTSTLVTVALGDAPNDQGMLECVDIPVVIKSAKSEPPVVETDQTILYTDKIGPEGWNQAILQILKQYDQKGA